jgi:nucleotide-binding universal stress UspA family protein
MRRAPVPVLVVPATCDRDWPAGEPLRVLVALDGSEYAEAALTAAGTLAPLGAEYTLLRVVEPPAPVTAEPGLYTHLFDPEAEEAAARAYLGRVAEGGWAAGSPITTMVEVGSPVAVLAAYAHQQAADLVVLATHGRSGLARLVLGSVATGVLQRAGTPVLLVRPTGVAAAPPAPSTVTLV